VQPQALAIAPGPVGLADGRHFIDRTLAEAVSNAIEHGAPCDDGRFHLAASVENGSFVFSVRDCGRFEDSLSPEPDPVAERGRGFAFMNLLMDEVRLDARVGETVLRLAKRLPGSPPPAREAKPGLTERNTRVVRQLFDAFAARDVTRMMQLSDRGVMIEPLSTPVRRRSPYLGVDGLRRYLRDLDETWQKFEISVAELRAGGDYVVALGRIYAQHQDLVADDPAGFAFKLRDARVVWAKVYPSADDALASAGLS
jgi:ketosteroid isomerase-like protein